MAASRRPHRLALVAALCAIAGALGAQAQTGPETPPVAPPAALTEVQKLRLVAAAKDVEVWQLRRQVVDAGLQKAQAALQALVASSTPKGYTLTDGLDLVPVPAQKAQTP